MKNDDTESFTFLIFLLFGLICIFMEFKFLEEDALKFKVFYFIAACVVVVITFVGIGLYIFSNDKPLNEMVYTVSNNAFKELKKEMHVTHLIFDENMAEINDSDITFDKVKYVQTIDFYADNLKINTTVFNKCKNLEEINFYSVYTAICDNAFVGCINLKTLNFYGDKMKNKNLNVKYPKGCKIHFIQQENLSETKEPPVLKEINITADVNINEKK